MLATCNEPLYILEDHVAQEPVTLRAKHHGKGGFTFSKSPTGASAEVIFTADSRTGLTAPRRLIKDAPGKAYWNYGETLSEMKATSATRLVLPNLWQ